MLTRIISIITITAALAIGAKTYAASGVGGGTTGVLTNVTVEQMTALAFYATATGPSGGTITASSTGTSVTGDLIATLSAIRGRFRMTCPNGTIAAVTITEDIILSDGAGNSIPLDLMLDTGPNPIGCTGVGTINFYVGGTATVGPGLPSGFYAGSYSVTVNAE